MCSVTLSWLCSALIVEHFQPINIFLSSFLGNQYYCCLALLCGLLSMSTKYNTFHSLLDLNFRNRDLMNFGGDSSTLPCICHSFIHSFCESISQYTGVYTHELSRICTEIQKRNKKRTKKKHLTKTISIKSAQSITCIIYNYNYYSLAPSDGKKSTTLFTKPLIHTIWDTLFFGE